jgi:cellobionic acid phosphorylase
MPRKAAGWDGPPYPRQAGTKTLLIMHVTFNSERVDLDSPTVMPRAAGFLWNRKMMIQVTCRGYAIAQYMQPEPAKYAYAPNLEARTFMQPEQPYYAHHPGRFFYFKDEQTGDLFSAPYEPVRAELDRFTFSVGRSDLRWAVERDGILVEICLTLPPDDVVELWSVRVTNRSERSRRLGFYPYFPIGYMSWMNQSARYREDLMSIVASCVTPYQKVGDYFKNRGFKDRTFFMADQAPISWETRREAFEGEGGLHAPSALEPPELSRSDALYETPAAVLQYRLELAPASEFNFRFLFGPAFDEAEIAALRKSYLKDPTFAQAATEYAGYMAQGNGCLTIETPDRELDHFVNHWLARQLFYHGDVNRLTTDPQTRNYFQDHMGMSYLQPVAARAAFLHALSQQESSGAMPDGILLVEGSELKYINQIPHTDHCVWLPVCLQAYLDETGDDAILDQPVKDHAGHTNTVSERISKAMRWLLQARDARGLSYIAQGDWCDPMNMVGYKGRGVSGWLSLASAYALRLWADVCTGRGEKELADEFRRGAAAFNTAVNQHLWDGHWFARGITDDGVVFGTSKDREGRIFLNPQSWALLAGTPNEEQRRLMLRAVEEHLETPYGPMLVAPAFTQMREDIGRVTQKFPGSAENGSVYNHAAAFYIYSLFTIGEKDRAFRLLRQMLPGPDAADYERRGQLPVFIPNYYRGAYYQYPQTAGRSSQLFNTGTVSWIYRCLIEELFGLKGDEHGLLIRPQLPTDWSAAKVTRRFRGATLGIQMRREAGVKRMLVMEEGRVLHGNRMANIQPGKTYRLEVKLPLSSNPVTTH